jgi:dCMP deaminase
MINNWDEYFYNICNVIASNSKCFSRKVGAILVKNKSIISTGYNGAPKNVRPCNYRGLTDSYFIEKLEEKEKEGQSFEEYTTFKMYTGNNIPNSRDITMKCPRQLLGYKSGEGLDLCVAAHGERNALIQAGKNGISTNDTIMYVNCNIPCKDCLIEIINAGVKEVVCVELTYYDRMSEYLIRESGLKIRNYII